VTDVSHLEVMDEPRASDLTQHRVERWLVYAAAFVSLTGIQMVVPALPALQRQLGLDDSQIALVTSVYLFPSVLAAVMAGVLAERYGRRRVFGGSLLLFGAAGALVGVVGAASFPGLLVLRAIQGIGFAGINPMTITALGDLFEGPAQVAVQGRRSLAMQVGDTVLPALGGILVIWSWTWPFLGPIVAIPLGFAVLRRYPRGTAARSRSTVADTVRAIGTFAKEPPLLALQIAGFVRFLLKFALLAYLPVLVVNQRGISETVAGLALGLSALAGGVVAVSADRLLRRVSVTGLVTASLLLLSSSLLAVVGAYGAVTVIVVAMVFGAGDGLYGVLQNALVAEAVDGPRRATFVAVTGAVRNLGKFVAPMLVAAVALVGSVPASFAVTAVVGVLAIAAVPPLRVFNPAFRPS
jgi:ACDE family multidrug resistance protein